MRSKLMTLVLVLATVALATSALAQDPIAYYPLVNDAADATGNHSDFILENCPFQDGGIYCDGDYWNFTATTPTLSDLDLNLFSVVVDFKIDTLHSVNMPVIWVSLYWRVLGFEITPDGYVALATGGGDSFVVSDAAVSMGEWHTARISFNNDMGFASCYMDGELVMLAERETPSTATDKVILPKNGSWGRGFEGILRNLYVYNTDEVVVTTEDMSWGDIKSTYRQQ